MNNSKSCNLMKVYLAVVSVLSLISLASGSLLIPSLTDKVSLNTTGGGESSDVILKGTIFMTIQSNSLKN